MPRLDKMLALRIKLSGRAPYPTSTKEKDDGRLRLFRWAMGWGTENMKVQGMPAHILVEFEGPPDHLAHTAQGKEKERENCKSIS